MNRYLYISCLPLLVGCMPGALDDPGFDLWCGASLCKWKTEQGSIRRVPTWNEEDYGVELVGKPAVLSQLASLGNAPCLRFSVLGNVDTEAELKLELDFSDDGTVDYAEGIPGIRWHRLDTLVKLPTQPYDGLKVSLDKQGRGKAVFASVSADGTEGCDGDPVQLSNLVLGDWCAQDADCASNRCNSSVEPPVENAPATCGECSLDADCDAGFICGAVETEQSSSPFRACILPQMTPDGDVCRSDQQCAHGHCVAGVCGECMTDDDCPDGRTCGLSDGDGVRACIPLGTKPSGSVCGSARECASGYCCIWCAAQGPGCPDPEPSSSMR